MKKSKFILIIAFLFAVVFFQSINIDFSNKDEVLAETNQTIPIIQSEILNNPNPEISGATISDAYYNLADDYLLIADNQLYLGLCWSFATTKTIETYLAVNFGEYYDLSEAWVSVAYRYYIAHNSLGVNDISDCIIGDGGHYVTYMNAINTYGIMLESDFPYENIYGIGESNYEEYFNAYKDLAKFDLIQDLDFGYWGDYHNPTAYFTAQEIVENMKDYLLNYGGMYCAVYSNDLNTNTDGTRFCLTTTPISTNHAMAIIGWDDNYTCVVNSITYTGAWIVLNSYGASDKIIYVMYDDVNVSRSYVVINSLTYNGINVNIDYPEQYTGLVISDSNSNYDNLEIASTDKLQKNLFQYSTEIAPSLTYTYSSSYSNPSFDFSIVKDNVVKTNLFTSNKNSTNKTFTITSQYAGLTAGNYTIEIYVDKDSNGTNDETYIKMLTILSGAEIEYCYSYSSNNQKEYSFQNHNSLLRENTTYYGFSNSNYLYLKLAMADYSKVTNYSINTSINYIVNASSTFEPATVSTYANGLLIFLFNFSNTVGIYEATLTFTTIDNFEYEYLIKIYRYSDSAEPITRINYFLNGGVNSIDNPNAVVFSSNAYTTFYKQYLTESTKVGYSFKGWYLDSNLTTPVQSDANGYYLTYDMIDENLSGTNFLYSEILTYYYPDGINYIILYAKYELLADYTITYNLDGGTNASQNPASYNYETETFSLQAPTKTGYTFLGWSGTGITGVSSSVTVIQGSTGDKTFTANWQENTYTITYNANGGAGSISSLTKGYMQSFTTAGTTSGITSSEEDVVLIGWRINATDTILPLNTVCSMTSLCSMLDIANQNNVTITLYAQWKSLRHNITYTMNGGENSSQNPSYYVETSSLTLVNPTKIGYTFIGWSGTGITGMSTSVTISEGSTDDKAFTANWQVNSYTIAYNSNGGTGNITSSTTNYISTFTTADIGDGISNTDVSKKLTGWKVGATEHVLNLDTQYEVSTICEYAGVVNTNNATITLYAVWEIEVFDIIFYDENGTTILYNLQEQLKGTTLYFSNYTATKTSTAQYTYSFVGWYDNINYSGDVVTQIMVSEDANYYAKYSSQINQYIISFYDDESDLIENKTYNYGTQLVFYTLSGQDKIYNENFSAEKTSTSLQDFVFAGWYVNTNYQVEVQYLTVSQATSLYAKFTAENKIFEINIYDENGEIADTISIAYGDPAYDLSSLTVDKPSTAQYDFEFSGWYDNPNFTGDPITSIIITDSFTLDDIYPKFSETLRSYSIYLYEDRTLSTVYRTLVYDYGEIVNLNDITFETEDETAVFIGWCSETGVLQTTSLTVTQNYIFYANFEGEDDTVLLYSDIVQILTILGVSVFALVTLSITLKVIRKKKVRKFNRKRAHQKIKEIYNRRNNNLD